jgi:signal transduction histidine kinase
MDTALDSNVVTPPDSVQGERPEGAIEQRRAETLLAGEKRVLEMVALGYALPVILDAVCRLVDEIADDCYCSILIIDSALTTFHLGAAPSLPAGYNAAMDGRLAQGDGGPCGMAAHFKTPVIVPDIAADSRWDSHGWRALALEHGLRACWSSPIVSREGTVLGTFAIYQREPRDPTPVHLQLIGQLTHIASIAIERAKSDAALKRSEAFLAEAQILSRTGSFSWCVPTGKIAWSEQVYRIFELSQNETVTFPLIASRVHPDDMYMLDEMINGEHGEELEFEHRLLMPDQSVKYLHFIARGTNDEEGRLEYIGAVQDVTERRVSEDALSKARSELAHVARVTSLGVMTASIAHEVSQPLSGVITNASTCLRMLATDPPNVDGARETIQRALRDGNRASDVIARLRSLFGRKVSRIESVDLNEAAREVFALSAGELQRSGALLRQELCEDLPLVAGDRVQLQQVMLNLLLNAADAMSTVDVRSRSLVVKTESLDGDRVCFAVRDAGTGIDAHTKEKLFEPFYTTKPDGMGIGLSISRSIVQSHNGRLWAVANTDGPGATFSFAIPRDVQRGTDGHQSASRPPSH